MNRSSQSEKRKLALRTGAIRSRVGGRGSYSTARTGITLIEILISMFILLFGLMGVAAIFPVASHYVIQGEQKERGTGLAQIAFEEIQARGLLQPQYWYYATHNSPTVLGQKFIDEAAGVNYGRFLLKPPAGPGHAFVIDPMGSSDVSVNGVYRTNFPYNESNFNPWNATLLFPAVPPTTSQALTTWPVRRMTLPRGTAPLNPVTARTLFSLRDDLAVELPKQGDHPAVQVWKLADVNNTPANPTDDQPVARQFQGDYTWLMTVVPQRARGLLALQPASNIKDEYYEVSTVVFYKRDSVPSATSGGNAGSERLIAAEFLNQGELALYDANTNDEETINSALDDIHPGNWIAVMGVNQTNGVFLMRWYRLLAVDDDTVEYNLNYGTNTLTRFAMVTGPDWPLTNGSNWNLRVAILPGVIDVHTRLMTLE